MRQKKSWMNNTENKKKDGDEDRSSRIKAG